MLNSCNAETTMTSSTTILLTILLHGSQLKRTVRSGWVMRGIPQPESVAEHSYGVAFTAMMLAPYVDEPLDLGRLLALALLHDLPEGLTTDLPAPVWRRLPDEIKPQLEREALADIFAGSDQQEQMAALWKELEGKETAAARLIKDADTLDMLIQAHIYQRQFGNRDLDEFWEKPRRLYFPISQAVYEGLVKLHNES